MKPRLLLIVLAVAALGLLLGREALADAEPGEGDPAGGHGGPQPFGGLGGGIGRTVVCCAIDECGHEEVPVR